MARSASGATSFDLDRKYEILETLGVGSMGTVYLARHRLLGRMVAIKSFRMDQQADLGGEGRFHQEARLLAGLRHDRLVNLYESGSHDDGPYLVMEYVEGEDLGRVLEGTDRLPPKRAVAIARGVLEALRVVHGAGIVHRDLKPANVMITRDGEVKVTDFGLAKSLVQSGLHTATGMVVGTPFYMPPEQAYGDRPHPSWDLYAVSTMLYEMLGGRRPFRGGDPLEVLKAKVDGPAPSLRTSAPDLPAPLVRLVDRGLSEDPALRPATADEFLAALDLAESGGPAPTARLAALVGRGQGRGRRRARVAAAVTAVILATTLAVLALRSLSAERAFQPRDVVLRIEEGCPVLRWETEAPESTRVLVEGMRGGADRLVEGPAGRRRKHELVLDDLTPGTRVRWRILSTDGQRSMPRHVDVPSLSTLRLGEVEILRETPRSVRVRMLSDRPVRSSLVLRRDGRDWILPMARSPVVRHEKLLDDLGWDEDFGEVKVLFEQGEARERRTVGRVAGVAVVARRLVDGVGILDPEAVSARWLQRLNAGETLDEEMAHVRKTEAWRLFEEFLPFADAFFESADEAPRALRMQVYQALLDLELLDKPFAVHGRRGPFAVGRAYASWASMSFPRLSPGGRFLLDGRRTPVVFTSKGVGFKTSFIGLTVGSELHPKIREAEVHKSLELPLEILPDEAAAAGSWELDFWANGLHPFCRFELRRRNGTFVAFHVNEEGFRGFTLMSDWIPVVERGGEYPAQLIHVVVRVPKEFLVAGRNEATLDLRCMGRFKRGDVFSIVGLRVRGIP